MAVCEGLGASYRALALIYLVRMRVPWDTEPRRLAWLWQTGDTTYHYSRPMTARRAALPPSSGSDSGDSWGSLSITSSLGIDLSGQRNCREFAIDPIVNEGLSFEVVFLVLSNAVATVRKIVNPLAQCNHPLKFYIEWPLVCFISQGGELLLYLLFSPTIPYLCNAKRLSCVFPTDV